MSWLEVVRHVVIGFNIFVLFYFLALNSVYLLLFLVSLGSVFRFVRRTFFGDYRQIMQSEMAWPISVIVPAHDEEVTIVQTVRSLRMLNYGEYEIIVVNDGSEDRTLRALIDEFGLRRLDRVYRRSLPTEEVRGIYGSLEVPNLLVVDKVKGGKADALNAGVNIARYPLFCSVDADSIIEDNALLRVVKPFLENPEETVAAGGIVRIANGCEVKEGNVTRIGLPGRMLPLLQVVEYLRGFLTGRVGWSALQVLLIISGAFGIYRKREVIEVGGFDRDSETEDLKLVVRLHAHMREKKRPYRIVFVPDPVCWTEVPSSFRVLMRQRSRWHRGLLRTLWQHRTMMLNPKHGAIGTVAFPYFAFFEFLGPFIEVLGYIVVPICYFLGMLNIQFFLLFLAVAVLYGIFLSVAAILLEELAFRRYPAFGDLAKLILFGVLENFGFRQVLALIRVKAAFDLILRRRGWGRMERKGFRPATH